MAASTRAIEDLERVGAPYEVHRFEVAEKVGEGYGAAVAAAIGMSGDRVFKTLVAEVDGEPVVAVIPVERRLSTKKLARAAGGKQAALAPTSTAERITGYVTGGISPFGLRRRLPLILDQSAMSIATIAVSGGRRGIQLEVSPDTVVRVTGAAVAPITDD